MTSNSDKMGLRRPPYAFTEQGVSMLSAVLKTDTKINQILNALEDETLKPKQGIFYDGQIFDAYVFINDLIKIVQNEIILIDNYIDETVFTLFSKYPNIKIKIYTANISKQLKLDFQNIKYNTKT